MKYTICGFSQAELIRLGLDVIDITILRWFIDFYSTGKMIHHTETKSDGTMLIYSWVKYDAVINDLPCLGINNTRVIGRRFDNLVTAKILEKKVKKTAQGTFTFFRIIATSIDNLLSSNNKVLPKNDSIPPKDRQSIPPVLESTGGEETIVKTDATVLKSDMRTESESTVRTVPKSTTIISFYQADPPITNKEKAAAAPCIKKLKEMCLEASPDLVFPQTFYERAEEYLSNLEFAVEFIPWVYKYVATKKPRDVRSYFMKVFFENDILSLFESRKMAEEAKKPKTIVCPVCSKIFEETHDVCPGCNLNTTDFHDETKIQYFRWKHALSPETIEQYEKERSTLLAKTFSIGGSYEVQYKQLNKKYGFTG